MARKIIERKKKEKLLENKWRKREKLKQLRSNKK